MVDTAFINAATYDSASSNSAEVSKPVDTAEGDIMFAFLTRTGSIAEPNSVPEDWTLLGITLQSTSAYYGLYYKIAGAAEPNTYTWGWVAAKPTKITIGTYRGGFNNIGNPIDAFSNTAYITNNTVVRAASMNVTNVNSTLVFFGTVWVLSSIGFTKPDEQDNDWVEDYDNWNTNPDVSQTFDHCNWSGSGATGVIDTTISGNPMTYKHAFAVALVIEAVGEDLIKIINETINIAESHNKLPGKIKIQNEAINIAESKNYTRGRLRIINEILNIGELKNYTRTLLRIINEILHISELKNKLMVLIRVKNEVLNISESFVKFIGGKIVKVINEVMNISEAKNRLMSRIRVINESINIGELKNRLSGIIRVKNEIMNLVETKNYIRGRIRVINEVINISEVKNKLRVLIRIKNEIINIAETKNKLMTLLRIKNETMNIAELKNTAKRIIRIINETVNITENIVKKIWIIIIQFPRNLKRIIILIRDRK